MRKFSKDFIGDIIYFETSNTFTNILLSILKKDKNLAKKWYKGYIAKTGGSAFGTSLSSTFISKSKSKKRNIVYTVGLIKYSMDSMGRFRQYYYKYEEYIFNLKENKYYVIRYDYKKKGLRKLSIGDIPDRVLFDLTKLKTKKFKNLYDLMCGEIRSHTTQDYFLQNLKRIKLDYFMENEIKNNLDMVGAIKDFSRYRIKLGFIKKIRKALNVYMGDEDILDLIKTKSHVFVNLERGLVNLITNFDLITKCIKLGAKNIDLLNPKLTTELEALLNDTTVKVDLSGINIDFPEKFVSQVSKIPGVELVMDLGVIQELYPNFFNSVQRRDTKCLFKSKNTDDYFIGRVYEKVLDFQECIGLRIHRKTTKCDVDRVVSQFSGDYRFKIDDAFKTLKASYDGDNVVFENTSINSVSIDKLPF